MNAVLRCCSFSNVGNNFKIILTLRNAVIIFFATIKLNFSETATTFKILLDISNCSISTLQFNNIYVFTINSLDISFTAHERFFTGIIYGVFAPLLASVFLVNGTY